MTTSPQADVSAPASQNAVESAGGIRAAIACAAIGVALVWLAGFSQMEALHNGAHDARHGAALPCH